MKEADVALAPLPQRDGQVKPRPVVVLRQMPPFSDWLVCGVSTQLQQQVPGIDQIIEPNQPDFARSGLKAASLIRLGFLTVLPASEFLGVIGSISRERHHRLLESLCRHLNPK
jgi:mRNA interferase MazF